MKEPRNDYDYVQKVAGDVRREMGLEGKAVIPIDEMVIKVRSAAAARRSPETIVIARTDALQVTDLDDVCRMQQVHDGAFPTLEAVPQRALSLTVPLFLRVPRALVFVNGERKAAAVRAALEGPIAETCPASALRRHPAASLFLDQGAASLLG